MLNPEQIKELVALTEQKKQKSFAEYHEYIGFIKALKLFDGSLKIVEDNDGKDEGDGHKVADSGGESES